MSPKNSLEITTQILSWIILASIFITSQTSSPEWSHHAILDRAGHFHFNWTPLPDRIVVEIQVRTKGYIALGFSTNGGMRGADITFAWIQDSSIFLQDRYAYNNSVPVLDVSQDLRLLGGFENETHTVISFSRPWDTCDILQDLILGSDTVRVIWAYHSEDPVNGRLVYHGHQRRGVRSLFLREKPRIKIPVEDEPFLKTWDLRGRNTRLPNDDHTHYWCQIFKAPQLEHKHHMIGFEPILQPGHETYLHHMVLYECHVGDGDSSYDWFDHHVNANGTACYSPNMPAEWSFCLATNAWAWAVGSEGEILPEHVGMPLGEGFGGATYFMLETHYDNPAYHKDLVDTSGFRIYYTDRLRRFDTAMLLVGSEVNFLHLVPPLQNDFKTVGRCSSECTQKGLDSDGIYILNGVLHSHLAGRQMRLRHIRNGKEMPVIIQDNSYDFNFQASRQPANETHVLPGDELLLECHYQTSDRQQPTFGGLSTRDEMCLGFMLYYPRRRLADCRSLPSLQSVMEAFGIESIYGQAFQKLTAFMRDIGGGGNHINGGSTSASLQELLVVLAKEPGRNIPNFSLGKSQAPITEEEILNRPFYSVVSEDEMSEMKSSNPFDNSESGLISESNYRTLVSEMMLSVRIRTPVHLQNRTVGQHVAQMDWLDSEVGRAVQDVLLYGNHSCLCLAHGRKPIIPYEDKPYPPIEKAAMKSKSADSCKTSDLVKKSKLLQSKLQERVHKIHDNSGRLLKSSLIATILTFAVVMHL